MGSGVVGVGWVALDYGGQDEVAYIRANFQPTVAPMMFFPPTLL